MLKSITLANYRSFGREVSVPLEPISVLVGPNNSGKSAFMSIGGFLRDCLVPDAGQVISKLAAEFLLHQPPFATPVITVGWASETAECRVAFRPDGQKVGTERIVLGGDVILQPQDNLSPFYELVTRWRDPGKRSVLAATLCVPIASSRFVKLSLDKLRADADSAADLKLGSDGSGLAAVATEWRSFEVDKAQRLDEFLRTCVPEFKRVLAKPAPSKKGAQRLWIEQADGTRFDAEHTSDGVLFFIALAMHVLDAPPGALIFIDEPENSIHPRRLVDLVELLRQAVTETKCQLVVATHSPVLLREFRDEPEAVLLFRRGDEGTEVTPLSAVPRLVDALSTSNPGELLADGFFNDPL